MTKAIKKKTCKPCGELFTPFMPLQKECSPTCALVAVREKAAKKEKKDFNAETRRMKEKIKTLTEYLNDAQKQFNKFIRLRDKRESCISCGRNHGGQYHAGHYRTTKAASQLRFNEDNCHKQCSVCNNHHSGNITEYRINLVKKIGQWRVEQLENNNQLADWTKEKAIEIKKEYRAKWKSLESG